MDYDGIGKAAAEFKARAREVFAFVDSEFGFGAPADESTHFIPRLVYRNSVTEESVHVALCYHDTPDVYECVVDYVLPEDYECVYGFEMAQQEPGLEFLDDAAEKLRHYLQHKRFADFKYL
jgi:hypothetical protein